VLSAKSNGSLPELDGRMKNNRRLRWLTSAIVFVGALYRYWPLSSSVRPCGTTYESLALACSLAKDASFSNPFATVSSGPSAHLAPLFPWLVSILIRWFGDGPAATNALQWMGALVTAGQLSLWPWFAETLGMGFVSGVIGAAGWLIVGFVLLPMWEAAYVGLLILVLVVCTYRILTRQVSTAFVLLTAALWGITFLVSPVPLLVYLALTFWIVCLRRIRLIQKLALIVIPFVVISPWIARNYQVFHHFVLIRDNFGMELSNGNNPCATFSFRENRITNCYPHPNENASEAAEVSALGEYGYNQLKLHRALRWIGENRGKFASLTEQRIVAFWFYTPDNKGHFPANILTIWFFTLSGVGGLWMLWKRDRNASGICLVWLVLFPCVYYVVAFSPRYRDPILWASFIPASFFLTELVRRIFKAHYERFGMPSEKSTAVSERF
jgi:hypothetical protein